ncbi:hypothetical protein PACTADRAFT_77891 [Pachysolen tannophilus NRRL Y-2460]|uniref:ATP synthase subunit a n=1 Tax=Pachysolen tannophilus NRRL Y-2460 TaxID=669874 RepID=A0A1E4TMX9_PACTA|nr:hypothetical protein PACTADRAFT_77891 [Pachysolen tannophilus NRRL Y-2460]
MPQLIPFYYLNQLTYENSIFVFSPLDQFDIKLFIGFSSPFIDLSSLNYTTFSLYKAIFHTILNMVKSQIGGTKYGVYVPLIYTLFVFILVANLIGMIPYSFALSSHLVFVIIFFGLFVPGGTPLVLVPVLVLIELLSYTARAISLGLRLSANTLSGHLLMVILGGLIYSLMSINTITLFLGLIPLLGVFGIVCLEFAIACIQSYVFTILTSSYIKDAVYLH